MKRLWADQRHGLWPIRYNSFMKRLVLIDGNAVLHRAYHAIPPLTAPDGSVVNAVYGFAAMLLRLASDLRPTYVAVAFDRPAPTFRKKLFAGYQSKRPKLDDDLASQIPKVHDLVEAFGIPIFEKDGFEADDVIGTLVKNAKRRMLNAESNIDQVIIVTGDRDILQLVEDDRVMVYMPTKGLSEAKLYHERDVVERLGVTPSHITDYKGFAGDSSDNYPGVEGIGPKTAITLINTFGTVEKFYAALKKKDAKLKVFSAGVLEKLIKGEKSARMSKDLATIRVNVKLDAELNKSDTVVLDTLRARKMLEMFHFHSLLKRLNGGTGKQETGDKEEAKRKTKDEDKPKGEQQELF